MSPRRRVAAVTGSRADYGLLRPVMRAIERHQALELQVLVAGSHLLPPQRSGQEVAADFEVAAEIPMQRPGEETRAHDAAALGRGVTAVAQWLGDHPADVVVVLGDRVEALAGAAAAAVAGVRVAHLHGGDRAEGIADEAMRHAITKLAHLHLPATPCSARRIEAMGEDPGRIHVVGSPALDELEAFPPLAEARWAALGRPEIVFLHHPLGRSPQTEREEASRILAASAAAGRVLALHPNHDPGRSGILEAIDQAGCPAAAHLPRREFVGLLRRARAIVGNSSAGLIEAAALGLPAVSVGPRQAGRERAANAIDAGAGSPDGLRRAFAEALAQPRRPVAHPFGDGRAGERAADVLAGFDPAVCPLTKRNVY